MTRAALALGILVLLTDVRAQCSGGISIASSMTVAVAEVGPLDERYSAPLPLGFVFPLPGATVPAVLDHAIVGTNGELYLTDGSGTGFAYEPYGIDDLAGLRGSPGSCPRIAAFADDLADSGGLPGDITVDTSVPGHFTVRWEHVDHWLSTGDATFRVTLRATGEVLVRHEAPWSSASLPSAAAVGVSAGDQVGNAAAPGHDLSSGTADSGSDALLFELFAAGAANDLAGSTLVMAPNGSGGFVAIPLANAPCAQHTAYGTGCYSSPGTPRQAFYELFPDTASSSALNGQAMTLTPNAAGDGYDVTWGPGTFVQPNLDAVPLGLGDDDAVDLVPSVPFPWASNTGIVFVPTLTIGSNGVVTLGPAGQNDVFAFADVGALLGDPLPAFRSSRDYDPGAPGSGPVLYEEVGGEVHLTWLGVHVYGTVAPETFQFRLDLASGVVQCVWHTLYPAALPDDLLVGYAPGASLDPGPIVIATQAPFSTAPDVPALVPLELSASPPPVITAGGASVPMTFTVANVPDLFPPAGFRACLLVFSAASLPGGVDLGSAPVDLGAPGCRAYVPSLDVVLDGSGFGSDLVAVPVTVPPPLQPGTEFFAQAFALLPPGTDPGTNAFGLRTSNGLASRFELE